MLRALTLFQLVQRLKAIEVAADNPVLQQFTIKDHVEEVLKEGWELAGSIYFNLFTSAMGAAYPETAQTIIDRTAHRDDFDLRSESTLIDDYLSFQGYIKPVENLIDDCWLLLGMGLESDGEHPPEPAPESDEVEERKPVKLDEIPSNSTLD